jgi:hypothetical protein
MLTLLPRLLRQLLLLRTGDWGFLWQGADAWADYIEVGVHQCGKVKSPVLRHES